MSQIDLRAIPSAVFLPLLTWTGSVIAITLFGYPGVVCLTPLAWLLAVPVGLRAQHESQSSGRALAVESFLAGVVLGLFQGLLFGGVTALSPSIRQQIISDGSNPLLASAAAVIAGALLTGGLSAIIAWIASRGQPQKP
jgi:hypothetical protein